MNKLSSETSPYLLQHKNNPVEWYPWGEEALQKAKTEDKIIILSIGYSACHWCHVMEHECFEDLEVASVMNTFFVNIKVDREERPDIDGIYMDALQNMGLRGGWPLNVFLMPNNKPFYGGTYFPKKNWINLLYGIQESFREKRQVLEESADGFAASLQTRESEKYTFGIDPNNSAYTNEEIELISQRIAQDFDTELGGMRRAPKFPMPSVWNLILNLSNKTGNETLIYQLKETLDRICLGGIFDHLAGGWTRYSTDERWKVPHFEKMLYDNGQLMALYCKSFLFFDSRARYSESLELYKWAVVRTIEWLRNEIIADNGGFYSALDADSEGEEGKYYVWKLNEVLEVLGSNADKFCVLYDINEAGNWEHQKNVLHLEMKPSDWSFVLECNQKLLESRQSRIKPGLDNKIICGWNGLMLSGLIEAYKVFGLGIDLIERNINFIEKNLISEYLNENNDQAFGLRHLYGVKDTPAFLDDYAAIIEAFLNYYQISFEEKWIFYAHGLTKYVLANFYDSEDQLFYFTDSEGEKLIARKKEIFDNVIPASNSAMVKNLYLLGRILGDNQFVNLAKDIFSKLKPLTLRDPQWLSNWTDLGLLLSSEEVEVVAYGIGYKESLRSMQKRILSTNTLFFGADSSSDLKIFEGRMGEPKALKIYICVNHACHLPVSNFEDALKLMRN